MFFKDFVSVKRKKIKKGASQTYDTPSSMICSILIPNRSGKENPCYTQIRLQKKRILKIRELRDARLQCGLNLYCISIFSTISCLFSIKFLTFAVGLYS